VAWRLAKAGAHVALIDASHPREKPCGGGVTGRALRLVADQLAAVPALSAPGLAIERAVFVQAGTRATVPLPAGSTLAESALAIFPRAPFDRQLLEAATSAGATHVNARARDVRTDAAPAEVLIDGNKSIRARVIVGADGANSLVRRRALAPFSRAELSIATGFFVRGASAREIVVEFVDDPPGYLWSFPRVDHVAVGVCAQADRTTADQLRGIATGWIEREQVRGTLDGYSWPIPSLPAGALRQQRPAGPGWLLVGDAAGLVDPITREGIFFALQSADLAADSILDARGATSRYVESLQAEILPELARAAALKAGFFRPRFMSLLVTGLQRSAKVRVVMADLVAGAQPYRTLVRRLLGTLELSLALELLRIKIMRE
jgi:flavin-dependent dehydrogenase